MRNQKLPEGREFFEGLNPATGEVLAAYNGLNKKMSIRP